MHLHKRTQTYKLKVTDEAVIPCKTRKKEPFRLSEQTACARAGKNLVVVCVKERDCIPFVNNAGAQAYVLIKIDWKHILSDVINVVQRLQSNMLMTPWLRRRGDSRINQV